MMKISEMPKYEAYKDSGVEWIGAIPVHWNSFPLCAKSKLKSISNNENEELLSVYLDKGVIKFDDVDAKRTNTTSSDLTKYQLVDPGDFVLNNQQAWRGSVGVSDYRGIVSPAYLVLSLSEDIVPRFGNYLFRDGAMVANYLVSSKGVGTIQRNLYWPQLKRALVFLPPTEEQLLIACFLDKKTALIDEAISIKEKQINLLKERKQIIIQQAVTQGLDPNVPMKDSGVDWIGKVPAHWEVKKMKFIFDSIQTGTTPVTSEPKYFDGDVDWYNPKDLNAGYLDKSEKTLSELAIKHGQAKIFPGDSVLIVGIGATCGKTAYLKSSSAFNQQITGFSSRHENAEFMYYLISMYSSVMLKVANYTTLPILNNEFFKHFLLPCPSKIEQDRIVGFLRIETLKFEKTIEIQLQQIERLKEYKTTLINSAVTGKIKITPEMVEQ